MVTHSFLATWVAGKASISQFLCHINMTKLLQHKKFCTTEAQRAQRLKMIISLLCDACVSVVRFFSYLWVAGMVRARNLSFAILMEDF